MTLLLNISAVVSWADMEPRQDKRNQIIAAIIIAAAILIGIAYFFSRSSSAPSTPSNIASSTAPTSTSSTSSVPGVTITSASSSSGYTVHLITGGKAPVAPNYKTPLVFTDPSVTADEQTSMQAQFAQVQAVIAANGQDFNSWIELGDLRKEAGDYAGAALDWQYMSALYSDNIVSNANLADVYTNYLHDYPKAAAAYKAAIVNNPKQTYLYQDLFQLYTNQYPQSTATIEGVLKQGITAVPQATDLMVTLARYYKSTGDMTDAKAEYGVAIASAQSQGQTALVTQIQKEEAGI